MVSKGWKFALVWLTLVVLPNEARPSVSQRDAAPPDSFQLSAPHPAHRSNASGHGQSSVDYPVPASQPNDNNTAGHGQHFTRALAAPMNKLDLVSLSDNGWCVKRSMYFDYKGQPDLQASYPPSISLRRGHWRVIAEIQVDMYQMAGVYLRGLQGVEEESDPGLPAFPPVGVDYTSPWWEWTARQNQPYTRSNLADHTKRDPTDAEFTVISSYSNRVIVVRSAHSLSFASQVSNLNTAAPGSPLPADQLPVNSQLSDISFMVYANAVGKAGANCVAANTGKAGGQFSNPPRWLLINGLGFSPETHAEILPAVTSCLNDTGVHTMPSWQNRVTFPTGSKCFHILLGTAAVSEFSNILKLHQYRFGPAVIGSITIYGDGTVTHDGFQVPSLLLWASSNIGKIEGFGIENYDHEQTMNQPNGPSPANVATQVGPDLLKEPRTANAAASSRPATTASSRESPSML